MKTKQFLAWLVIIGVLSLGSISRADDITAVQSGNWSDTNTWNTATVPGANDDADIPGGITVTVDTNVVIQFIYDSGTVKMGDGSTLDVLTDSAIDPNTTLDATTFSNTVIYSGNVYFAKKQNYRNLTLDGLGTFYNGDIGYGAVNIIVDGNLILSGTAGVQAGANITVNGNLIVGTTNILANFDCSVAAVIVKSNTFVSGFLLDGDGSLTNAAGGLETNHFLGNVTINPGGTWNVSDVTTWAVDGSFTNLGTIKSKGYGSITFEGTGSIAGNPFQIRAMTISGTYAIGTTVTLFTNTPTLNGTLVFDLVSTNKIIYFGGTNALYYSGNLNVINTGPTPVPGNSYQLFSGSSYGGNFSTITLPDLLGGLAWANNLASSGSFVVIGGTGGSPILSASASGGLLTLSWDSATYPGYSVQAQTNSSGIGTNWSGTTSGTVSPFPVTVAPANPSVFYRLYHP